jgi:hypothetical protein
MGGVRKTFVDPETGRVVRICRKCGELKDYERDFAIALRGSDGSVTGRCYHCKPCNVEYKRERTREKKKNPGWALKDTERQRVQRRKYRARDPEKARAQRRSYMDRVKANPQRHARFLEGRRIEYRLRAERLGRTVVALAGAKMAQDSLGQLPIEPLRPILRVEIARRESLEQFAADIGVASRTVKRWLVESDDIQFGSADHVLTALDRMWWEVWTEDEYPEAYAKLAA